MRGAAAGGEAIAREREESKVEYRDKALLNLPESQQGCPPPKDGDLSGAGWLAGAFIRRCDGPGRDSTFSCLTMFTAGEDSGSVYVLLSPNGKDLSHASH